jgi:hypothetical protein
VAAVNIDTSTVMPFRRRPSRSRRVLQIISLHLSVALLPLGCLAQDHSTESQVKAAYLYNFGKFVTWPADSTLSPQLFQICVLGKDPFGAILDTTVNGESIDRKKIQIRRLAKIQDAPGCNVLYVSSSEEARLSAILAEAQRLRLLTVSDIPHFAERGGTIGLVTQQDRIRFEVNRSAAEQTHLVLSSELLKIAIRVIQNHKGS